MPEYRTKSGYAFKRPAHGRWQSAEIVVLPREAEGCEKVVAFADIDGVPCVIFATPAGRFAQTAIATRVS